MGKLNINLPRPHRHLRALTLLIATTVLSALLAPSQAAADPFGPGSPEGAPKSDRIRGDFFGMDIGISPKGPASWPGFALGGVRVSQAWSAVERSPGVYDWAHLDLKVASVEQHHAKPLIVIEGTPAFHALGSAEPTFGSSPRLSAYRSFVRKLVSRYGTRADYQVWNEANIKGFFTGTPAHMAAMTAILGRAAKKLAPAAIVAGPSFPLRGENPALFRNWFRDYWKQTIGKRERPVGDFMDVATISAYPMPDEDPEDALAITQWARQLMVNRGFEGPVWAAEINYGASGLYPTLAPIPMKRQVAFVVRTYALHATIGADRVYWWRWEGHQTVNTLLSDEAGAFTPAGTAFGVVEDWLLGTRPTGCEVAKGVTVCGFRARKGVDRYVYWTRSGRTRTVRAPQGATTKTDPADVTTSFTGKKQLRVGLTPIMVTVRSK